MAQSATARKPRKASAPPGESKADKFTRLAVSRTRIILKQLRLLANLASTSQYEKTPKQVTEMRNAIVAHTNTTFDRLLGKSDGKAEEFSFSKES